ncbi:helix-turn-helix domain-containing protein [Streptomyces cyaneochromogenes]|uniref:citrate synthase (unknown stereospecificity) n=1 Tax=Streptomyces cyaneochromogenes TaxID=2496836 RepID=A0A3Q9EWZ7_9ACTN|nr:citrate synthase [Streptomyces cyaneochromogenes]AZQ37916.1 helix-turn-helix domain-containing protein [Streptomyces cyaneochromogenes]
MRDQEPGPGPAEQRLTTQEAAELLGVKPETVYAYVSRGHLSSRRAPGGRGSTFDAKEVETLARRNKRESAGGSASGGELSVRTRLTFIDTDRYYFRGVDATELASRHSYEEVAEWLWTGRLRRGVTFTAPEAYVAAARRAVGSLPEHADPTDRLRVAAIAAAATDPLRFDLSEEAVLGTARVLIPTLVAALTPAGFTYRDEGSVAQRLWDRLSGRPADEAALKVLDTALALLVDHDLAASTLAVRVAASARAHAYAAVSAGLGVIEGPLHGAASGLAHKLIMEVLDRGDAGPVIAQELRAGRSIPGLGHRLYPGEDPRARVLFELLEELPHSAPALAAARDIVATAARHTPLHANVDLALAVFTASSAMPSTAGETIFAVARTAGWIAHALEEYEERPLRMRPSGHYAGPKPPQPLPE